MSVLDWFRFLQFKWYTGLGDTELIHLSEDTFKIQQRTLQSSFIRPDMFTFSQALAKSMCILMAAAYETPDVIEHSIGNDAKVILRINEMSIVHIPSCKALFVLFAGTKVLSVRDWWMNITGSHQIEWDNMAQQVLDALEKYPENNVVVCGHSKGGVLAKLAYKDIIQRNTLRVAGCYVAGVPDRNNYERDTIGLYNIKHTQDPVAMLLGDVKADWSIQIGSGKGYDIRKHKIQEYINTL